MGSGNGLVSPGHHYVCRCPTGLSAVMLNEKLDSFSYLAIYDSVIGHLLSHFWMYDVIQNSWSYLLSVSVSHDTSRVNKQYNSVHERQYLLNPLHANYFSRNTNMFTIHIIPPLCHDTGCWNPFLSKTSTCLVDMANIMAPDDLVMQGARASAAMILT